MEKIVKHTNNKQFQCYHNNIGYCKFGAKCRFKHFSELCAKKVCMDSECRFRHPKSCKFAEKCKFFQRNICAFKHSNNKELEKLEKEVKELELDVSTLKKVLEDKEEKLRQLTENNSHQDKMILELKTENSDLKSQISKLHSNLKEQTKLIETKDEIISNKTIKVSKLLRDFECEKCQFQAESLMEFNFHLSQKHPTKSTKHLKCQKCDFKRNSENDMKIHKTSKHITSKKLEPDHKKSCENCDFSASNHFDLLLHNSMKHPGKV